MPQPPEYERVKDFTTDLGNETDHSALNAEFDSAANSINAIRTNLAILQADDGKLKADALTGDLQASLTSQVYENIDATLRQYVIDWLNLTVSPAGQDPSQWKLTLNEEFNYFNTGIWNDIDPEFDWDHTRTTGTVNYRVIDGLLKMWPAHVNDPNTYVRVNPDTQQVTSTGWVPRTITTEGKWEQEYGFFEIEAKLPRGKGVWPAFWLNGLINEIDIMEAYPGKNWESGWVLGDANMHPIAFEMALHQWYDNDPPDGSIDDHQYGEHRLYTPDLSAGFHKYGCKWEPGRITWYFDGAQIHTYEMWMTSPMHIILDLWYENQPTDHPTVAGTPQGEANSFEIKYVRVWKSL